MKRLLQKISLGLCAVSMLAVFAFGATANAQGDATNAVCRGVAAAGGSGCGQRAGDPTVTSVVRTGINIFSVIVGVAAVIMIIVGGLKYILSSGDPSNITSAKNTVIYAIVGLIVVSMAQLIVKFVLGRTT
ncbi:MAG: rane protein of unknown function [Candidatus Saccharibacteria bacterium]|nr:rane protein of unknown function [Candidatus Saccharibacteria bacterium]